MFKKIKRDTIIKIMKEMSMLIVLTLIVLFGIKNIASVAKSAENLTGLPSTSWMALIGVVLGQVISLYIRIFEKIMNKKEEIEQSTKMTESIISNFLSKEINDNLKLIPISGIKKRIEELEAGSKYNQFGFGNIQFEFKEYDKVKYEIIKYNNESTFEVLEIYNLFYFLMDKKDLKNMTIEEIKKIVNMYDKYVDKYLIKI